MDNDDLLIDNNALEKFYNYAENYSVDVVCTHKYISFEDAPDKLQLKNPKVIYSNTREIAETPLYASENIAERINDLFQGKIHVMPWLQFSRRDFLVENEIYFPEVLGGEDVLWIMHVICEAKKILLIPDTLYATRTNPDSITRSPKTVEQKIKNKMFSIVDVKFMKALFNKEKFFQENPQYWYAWLNHLISYSFSVAFQDCANLNPYEVYKIFHEQFAQDFGENAELISYLCSVINTQQKQLYLANAKILELEKRLSQS